MSDLVEANPFFKPRPGITEWWTGDPAQLGEFNPNEEHPSLVHRLGVLSPAQCDTLIDCFERNQLTCAARTGSDYWDGRYIWQARLPPGETQAQAIMQQLRLVAQVLLQQEFQPSQPLYSDTAQLVAWTPGLELRPHTDNIEPDGSPNGTPYRCYSSLLYLNDDYAGGETYFPGFGIRVKPRRGMMILFGSGPEYVHGVSKVTRGKRYTYAGWFTYDRTWEDPLAKTVF